MTPRRFQLDAAAVDPDIIARAALEIQNSGIVVFPTRCLYGLAADAGNPAAVGKIFTIKQRPKNNPILVLISDIRMVDSLAASVPEPARAIMRRFWPGQVTIVLPAREGLPPALTAGTGKIGVRHPDHPVAMALAAAVGRPITGTSANISKAGGCADIAELDPEIRNAADLILDAGPLAGGAGSTVVDVTCDPVRILREGVVPGRDILAVL